MRYLKNKYLLGAAVLVFSLSFIQCGKKPLDAAYYHKRGLAFYDNGHTNRAVINYLKAIKIDENCYECYKDLGRAFLKQNLYMEV